MKMTRIMKNTVFAALLALTLGSFNASAAFIEGAITMSGDFAPTGGTNLGDATGLDFLGDDFGVDDATGDFALAGIMEGDIGTYHDFVFAPLAAGTPIWSISGFDFALDSIDIVFQSSMFLVLQGTGMITNAGFDDTTGSWNLTANASGALFVFSAGTAAIAEPSSLAILGLGLIGLTIVRRRAR